MQKLMEKRAVELLNAGSVDRVLGWARGEFPYDMTPAVFRTAKEVEDNFVYNDFCGANLSKYLIGECKKGGRIAVFLKPCDTYSFNQLLNEHRIAREMVYVIGIECYGKADPAKLSSLGLSGVTGIVAKSGEYTVETVYGSQTLKASALTAERCLACKSKKHVVYDELIGAEGEWVEDCDRFAGVEKLEKMSAEERYAFWRGELSRCIRCNACRNVCPACSCEQCVFDNPASGVAQKAAVTSFEENMFHIIRAFHVAGRCTDCGECSRVCPQHIPLHLLNRKFIKDVNNFYGEYQAGAEVGAKPPLGTYTQNDMEPGDAVGGGK